MQLEGASSFVSPLLQPDIGGIQHQLCSQESAWYHSAKHYYSLLMKVTWTRLAASCAKVLQGGQQERRE